MNLVLKRMKQFMFMSITKVDIISVSFVALTIPRIEGIETEILTEF